MIYTSYDLGYIFFPFSNLNVNYYWKDISFLIGGYYGAPMGGNCYYIKEVLDLLAASWLFWDMKESVNGIGDDGGGRLVGMGL